MLDLVCKRYPGRRPSDYLEIDDPYTALQLDYAIASKHNQADNKFEGEKLEAIHEMLKPIGSVLGVKYEAKPESKLLPEDLPIDVALAILGGKGTSIKRSDG